MNWRLRKNQPLPLGALGEAARAKREPDRAKPQEWRFAPPSPKADLSKLAAKRR